MTSRRSRIKGIANIPQRRKNVNEESEEKSKNSDKSSDKNTLKSGIENNVLINVSEVVNDVIPQNIPNPSKNAEEFNQVAVNEIPKIEHTVTDSQDIGNAGNNENTANEPPSKGVPISKRRFLKIPVSLSAIQRNKRPIPQTIENTSTSSQELELELSIKKVCTGIEKPTDNDKSSTRAEITEQSQVLEDYAVVLDDSIKLPADNGNLFQRPLSISNAIHSDTEYSLPPPSPNKANRSRIKAIPRLAHRKTSFSASESEDESKKINRIRNDSVCSTTSVAADSTTELFSPQRPKDVTTVVPQRSARTEQTRKLAEARREFYRRFGEKKPERHKLTMMDLIFYNPDSSPMMNEEKNEDEDDPDQFEDVDDPKEEKNEKTEEAIKSDEENDMPVPQIKIGPSGEIILDERSLVIERKEVQRQREEMQRTKIIDADKSKTGYGIYKKHKRSKYWSQSETLRFYKALNTIGTDFMLMCELFPSRGRRELKMKFKKEERVNRHLIDRALMQPCSFDFDDLKNEIEMEERELEELRKYKEEQKRQKEEKLKEYQEKIIEKAQKRREAESKVSKLKSATPKIVTSEPQNEKALVPKKPKSVRKSKKEKLSIKNFMSDSDADESDMATQSESEEDVKLSRKPTRSGRLPKEIQRYENELSTIMKRNKIPDHAQPSNIQPGSIMIITEKGPNGEPVYKIYMVTPEHKATRLDLSTDMVAKAIQLKRGVTAESIMTISANVTDDEEMPEENNVTIPADDKVTSLKTGENSFDGFNEESLEVAKARINEDSPLTNQISEAANEDTDKQTDKLYVVHNEFIKVDKSASDCVEKSLVTDNDDEDTNMRNHEKLLETEEIKKTAELDEDFIRLLATQEDECSQDNLGIFNGAFDVNSKIVLEVKSDGVCSKIQSDVRTEENASTVEDENDFSQIEETDNRILISAEVER